MVKIILVRHGYSETNRDKKFTGQRDVPLDKTGVAQGKSASEYIHKNYHVDKIYSSDLCRAVDTVKPLADALCLDIETNKAFREISLGKWEGMYIEAVKALPEYKAYKENPAHVASDGGENFTQMTKRAMDALGKIAEENHGKTVVIASHGGLIKGLCCYLKNGDLENINSFEPLPNASITVLNYDKGKYTFELEGYCDYLSEITAKDNNH